MMLTLRNVHVCILEIICFVIFNMNIYYFLLGWVNKLVSGYKTGAKGFAFFIANLDLTDEGIGKFHNYFF